MKVDVLIIGQGISGSFLAWNLLKLGVSVVVIDRPDPMAASRVASGVINPVTGRTVVATWLIDELLPFCQAEYSQLGDGWGREVIRELPVTAFAHTEQMQQAYEKRIAESYPYVHPLGQHGLDAFFNFTGACYTISPAFLVDIHATLQITGKTIREKGQLREESFNLDELVVSENKVGYKDCEADRVVFCNGTATFDYPFWKNIPYTSNKGEALLVSIPGLSANQLYKFGHLTLVPWQEGTWWVGSSFERDFKDVFPSESFRRSTENWLGMHLKLPFQVLDRLAGIRPSSIERRPFVGWHPAQENVGILNGMGTKGCSLAPWFAAQLSNNIVNGRPIDPLADVRRFSRIMLSGA